MTRTLRPRPYHPVLRRSADSLQFGVGPGGSVELRGGSPALHRLLLDWRGEPADDLVRRAVAAGVPEPEVHEVLGRLGRAGALVDSAVIDRVQAVRAGARVLVTGNGPLRPGLTGALADAGVGGLEVAGPGPSGAAGGRADLVVLTDHPRGDDPPPAPHLLVRLVDGLGLVGPLVLPRRTACLRCVDLHLAARDPCWPTVAADLAGRVGSAGAATVAATAALAAEQVLAALEAVAGTGPPPPTLESVLELDLRSGTLRRRRWPPHPECRCGARHTGRATPGVEGMCAPTTGSRESGP